MRTLAVIAHHDQETALAQLAGRPSIGVIAQPINRETAVGILLAVTHVYTQDPEAMVVVFPSDHFVRPEQQFLGACAERGDGRRPARGPRSLFGKDAKPCA